MDQSRFKKFSVEKLISIYGKYGNPDVLEAIIEKNRKLVYKIAHQYRNSKHNTEDLIQIAYTGLLVAINRFDTKKDNKFSTFAYYCIKGEIQHYLRDNNLINIPRWIQKLNIIFRRFILDFESKNGRYPTKEEISSGINISIESVDEILRAREVSFYSIDSDKASCGIEDTIDRSQIKSKVPKSFELVMEDKIILWDAIDRLKGLNKKILVLKYVLGFSQEEIGRKMGLSQKAISRNIKDSLEKIKENIT